MQQKNTHNGIFTISLDFELFWGVWDVTTIKKYGDNITGVKEVIPRTIALFNEYNIKATFATVGFIFAKDKNELLHFSPQIKPTFTNSRYNVYEQEIASAGNDERDDCYHFGFSLLEQIRNSNHELATHTFSHYYFLEEGQTAEQFSADIEAAIEIAKYKGIKLESIVFPRNQYNEEYLHVLKSKNINTYRGNPTSWIYKPRKFTAEILFIRLCRLLDTYLPISGYNTHSIISKKNEPVNIPASRFLKPYNPGLAWLEKFKLHRIMNEMTKAAKKKELYHLWWHPHNFGVNINENFNNLTIILNHYQKLQQQYGFISLTMKDAAAL